jgi:hypothetical protein
MPLYPQKKPTAGRAAYVAGAKPQRKGPGAFVPPTFGAPKPPAQGRGPQMPGSLVGPGVKPAPAADPREAARQEALGKAGTFDAGQAAKDAAKAEAMRKSRENRAQGLAQDSDGDWKGVDDLDDLAKLKYDQKEELKARGDELAAEKAKALQAATARADFGGMGLSGATAALQSDIGRTQDRARVLALSDLAREQRGEARTAEQHELDQERAQLLWDMQVRDIEEQSDIDYDEDGYVGTEKVGGKVGDGDPENNPGTTDDEKDDIKDAALAKLLEEMNGDGSDFNPETGTVEDAQALREAGVEFRADDARFESDLAGRYWVVVRDEDGKLFKIEVDEADWEASRGRGDDYAVGEGILKNLGLV